MPTGSSLARKQLYFWLAALWTTVIAVLCLASFNKLPSVKVEGADKYVHAIFHFFFTVFWSLYFTRRNAVKNIPLKVLAASVFYGILIEICQELFTTTRQADIKDVAANFTGALLAVLVLLATRKFTSRPTT
jgi:VanZ family protein